MKRMEPSLMVCLGAAALLAGCAQPKMDPAAMKPPERPTELNMLDPWVGTWQVDGEMTMPDGTTMKSTGTANIAWECDRHILVERMEASSPEMKDMGKMYGMIVYSWDAKDKEFDTVYFNNMNMIADGDMKYDEATRTWTMTGEGYNPMAGQNTHWVGEMKMTDNNTMDYTWTTWDSWKMKKLEWGKGTARKM